MAKMKFSAVHIHEPIIKKTSIGGRKSMVKTSSMNKHKRRSYKPYIAQGR